MKKLSHNERLTETGISTLDFRAHRPPDDRGLGDAQLLQFMRDLAPVLIDAQSDFAYDTLSLPEQEWAKLAHVLVEFAEDIHNDIGLWHSLETYQRSLFGTPLPLTMSPQEATEQTPALADRLSHLLWVLYGEINPDLLISPTHQDLRYLAATTADFLVDRLKKVPKRSGVKQFLARHNRRGWTLKRKLLWLGQHSYLFRYSYHTHMANREGQATIAAIDDFICQTPTAWAGLGVLDILAETLPLSKPQRQTLGHWKERHLAYYQVLRTRPNRLKLRNLLSGEIYQVQMDGNGLLFETGKIVLGIVVSWEGQWYWSGEQRFFNEPDEATLREMKDTLIRSDPAILYRYDPARRQLVEKSIAAHERFFLDRYGDNLVIYPDGLAMAADMQDYYQGLNEQRVPEPERTQILEAHGMSAATPAPQTPYPAEITANENGIGLFFNPGEGIELMINFNDVLAGLRKRGVAMTEHESEAIRLLIEDSALSPAFVRRLVRDEGAASIAEAFLIRGQADEAVLDYLLRRHKGHFYGQRYPGITIV